MTDLEREVALAISPNIKELVPEEWLQEAKRAILAIAIQFELANQPDSATWLKNQLSRN